MEQTNPASLTPFDKRRVSATEFGLSLLRSAQLSLVIKQTLDYEKRSADVSLSGHALEDSIHLMMMWNSIAQHSIAEA